MVHQNEQIDESTYAAVKSVDVSAESSARAKRKGGPWHIVLIVSVIVLIASLAALALLGFSYWQGQQKYEETAKVAQFDLDDKVRSGQDVDLSDITIDWDALLAINSDTVGWIFIPNTNVNYPIVQGTDNDYYLTRDFEYQEGWAARYGAIFMDYRNDFDFSDQVNFIYGHNMNDGSMFAAIAAMRDQAKFDDERTVYLLTPKGNYRLRSFSLVHCSPYEQIIEQNFSTAEEFEWYVQDKIDRSIVWADGIPEAADISKVFAFSTCDGALQADARFILMCYVEATTVKGEHTAGVGDLTLSDITVVDTIGGEVDYAINPLGEVSDKLDDLEELEESAKPEESEELEEYEEPEESEETEE